MWTHTKYTTCTSKDNILQDKYKETKERNQRKTSSATTHNDIQYNKIKSKTKVISETN